MVIQRAAKPTDSETMASLAGYMAVEHHTKHAYVFLQAIAAHEAFVDQYAKSGNLEDACISTCLRSQGAGLLYAPACRVSLYCLLQGHTIR